MFQIHRTPRRVQVVQSREPFLNVDARPELGSRTDQDAALTIIRSLEQRGPGHLAFRLMNESDLVGRKSASSQLSLELGVHIAEQRAISSGVSESTSTASSSRSWAKPPALGMPRSR